MKNTPFYRNYFISISDILESKLKAHERDNFNPQDKGELCEVFMKDFLFDAMGDLFKIHRGGNIINSTGEISKQIDIILCRKRSLKLFADKGIYPIESVMGAISITSTLTLDKFINDAKGLLSIPKKNYRFNIHKHLPETFRLQTHLIYQMALPFTCIFAYRGEINENWIAILEANFKNATSVEWSLLPSIIAVNKKGLILRTYRKGPDEQTVIKYQYMDISHQDLHGETFGRIVNELFNLSHEEYNMFFDYTDYFNASYDFLDNPQINKEQP